MPVRDQTLEAKSDDVSDIRTLVLKVVVPSEPWVFGSIGSEGFLDSQKTFDSGRGRKGLVGTFHRGTSASLYRDFFVA